MIRYLFDAAVSALGLIVLSPVFVFVAVWIKLDSRGPVFHRGLRVGRNGKRFHIYKFRTMRADASGPGITVAGDGRVTRAGKVLRRTKLDEVPQLINVLKGEMALVGPRPEDPEFVALYDTRQQAVLKVRPGITSPASLAFKAEEKLLAGPDWHQVYVNQIMPRKLELELDYLHHRTMFSDVVLIGRTLLTLLN